MNFLVDGRALQSPRMDGIPRVTYRLILDLAALNTEHQFWVFTSGLAKPDLNLPKNIHRIHLPVANKIFHAWIYFFHKPHLDQLAHQLSGVKIDAVFLPNLNFFASQAPYVLLVHDLSFLVQPSFYTPYERFSHAIKKPISLIQNATRLLTISKASAWDIKKIIGRGDAVTINPAPIRAITISPHVKRQDILVLGTTDRRKNLEIAIRGFLLWKRSFSEQPDRLLIAGALTKNGRTMQRRFRNHPEVIWLGAVNDALKGELLKKCRALLFPSKYEGFGLPIIEAYEHRLPVITGQASSLPEIAKNSAILVDPERPESIAQALKLISEDQELVTELGRRSNLALKSDFGADLAPAILDALVQTALSVR
ncbi:MAG: glycosyltransferase family 1 protein [bacterium]